MGVSLSTLLPPISSVSVPLPEVESEYFLFQAVYEKSSVQHGVQLVGQVVKHVADVVQNGPCRLHCV